jgi:hypothetical protein
MRTATVFLAAALLLFSTGCQATRDIGAALLQGLVNGLLDTDEHFSQQLEREERDSRWKGYWEANPEINPEMTEAFVEE